jgi:hypothetical protein
MSLLMRIHPVTQSFVFRGGQYLNSEVRDLNRLSYQSVIVSLLTGQLNTVNLFAC